MSSLFGASIIVVGAGVLGLATAVVLKRRGAKVRVIDPDGGRSSASAAAAGMISPALEAALEAATPERAAIYRAAADLWPAFARSHGLSLMLDGADWLGPLEPMASRLDALGLSFDRRPDRLHVPREGRIEVRTALAALAAELGPAGVVETRVQRITPGPSVHTQDGSFNADFVVLAAGSAVTGISVEGADPELAGITPVKGQIIALAGAGTEAVERIVRSAEVYLVPGPDGIIAGATMEPGVADRVVDPAVVERLRLAAVALVPQLAEARVVRSWAGVRGETRDGLPLAGKTSAPAVLASLAPRRNGWLLAPLVAEIVAAAIAGEAPPQHAQAFRPDRFGPA